LILSKGWYLLWYFQDIFRKYPSTYEGVIPTLCANLDELDEPEAKASLIWIIGEYANKIDNADELLGIFVDTFTEESYPVRLCFDTSMLGENAYNVPIRSNYKH
jgi:vesicle coat complex subunit